MTIATNFTPDDPRLTAYALGEVSDQERAAIEQAMASDPNARVQVEQIRALSQELSRDLAVELAQVPGLSWPQRARIAHEVTPRRTNSWRMFGWGGLVTAAATLAAVIVPSLRMEGEIAPAELAQTAVQAVQMTSVVPAPAASPAPPIEVPPEITLLEEQDVVVAAAREQAQANEGQLYGLPKVSSPKGSVAGDVETGSTGAFMAIGRGGETLPRGREHAVAASAESEGDVQSSFTNPASGPGSVGMFGSRSGGPPRPARRSSASAPREFRLAPPGAAPELPPVVTAGGEAYAQRADHDFSSARTMPLSTFGLDVDTASYGNVRRMIETGRVPPRDAVRLEELVNYFPYEVPAPANGETFGVTVEITDCPWQPAHQLARIAVRGKDLAVEQRPALNLVFLVDVSGSMSPENRLPLLKTGLSLLTATLRPQDRVAIVTYANSASVALPGTSGSDQRAILRAVDALSAGGGTNGGSGIQLAYQAAHNGFIPGGVNRVILCTDGDFNVGVTNRAELVRMVQGNAQQGVFLSVLGVGQDNLKDATMELIADRSNGNYHYLDTIAEARKVLVEQMSGTLITIAKDVKAQVEFNPARIAAWRQLGYEKRALAAKDFNDDRKDAGEVGAGHLVTMLYELVTVRSGVTGGEGLRYQPEVPATAPVDPAHADELMTVKVRFKPPTGDVSQLIQGIVTDAMVRRTPSEDQAFAAAVAAFGMRLRGAADMSLDWSAIRALALSGRGRDVQGYRQEFVNLVDRVAPMSGSLPPRE